MLATPRFGPRSSMTMASLGRPCPGCATGSAAAWGRAAGKALAAWEACLPVGTGAALCGAAGKTLPTREAFCPVRTAACGFSGLGPVWLVRTSGGEATVPGVFETLGICGRGAGDRSRGQNIKGPREKTGLRPMRPKKPRGAFSLWLQLSWGGFCLFPLPLISRSWPFFPTARVFLSGSRI